MKFRKLDELVELPEKESSTKYINVRSSERTDVRPGEMLFISTGIEVYVAKGETATVHNVFDSAIEKIPVGKYVPLQVSIYNPGTRNMMIYPGQVIGYIEFVPRKPKKATFVSKATLIK